MHMICLRGAQDIKYHNLQFSHRYFHLRRFNLRSHIGLDEVLSDEADGHSGHVFSSATDTEK